MRLGSHEQRTVASADALQHASRENAPRKTSACVHWSSGGSAQHRARALSLGKHATVRQSKRGALAFTSFGCAALQAALKCDARTNALAIINS